MTSVVETVALTPQFHYCLRVAPTVTSDASFRVRRGTRKAFWLVEFYADSALAKL